MDNTREKHIDTLMHIGDHIRPHEEYELLFDTPLVEAIEYVLAMLKNQDANGVIVLPCKVGDTVWFTTYGDIPTCTEVYRVSCNIGTDGLHSYFETQDTNGNTDYFHGEAFGKTVFLSREEAEKALAERRSQ